jgi:drug/metabolite transporter (DMT)-like permease
MKAFGVSFLSLTREQVKMNFARSIFSGFAMYFSWFGFYYISIGLHAAIFNLTPLLTLVCGYVFIRETLKLPEIINMIVSFGGVIFIILCSDKPSSDDDSQTSSSIWLYYAALLSTLLSVLAISFSNIVIRAIKEVHYTVINGFYGIFLLIISSIIWFIYRILMGQYVDYNFTGSSYWYMIIIGMSTAIGN